MYGRLTAGLLCDSEFVELIESDNNPQDFVPFVKQAAPPRAAGESRVITLDQTLGRPDSRSAAEHEHFRPRGAGEPLPGRLQPGAVLAALRVPVDHPTDDEQHRRVRPAHTEKTTRRPRRRPSTASSAPRSIGTTRTCSRATAPSARRGSSSRSRASNCPVSTPSTPTASFPGSPRYSPLTRTTRVLSAGNPWNPRPPLL